MPRMLLTLIAGLAAGVANAGLDQAPETAEHSHAAHAGSAPAEPGARTLAELLADAEKPELWIGSKAPALKLSHFARGESITSFEPGRTYVVEFWATWCGPCIRAFPHVASLQEKYSDKLSVIGVNIWERGEDRQPLPGEARVAMVDEFVAKHTEMKYTVAIEEGTAMAETWMMPAGQNGIPAAFIVDGTGKVAWMGHPMSMDEPLGQIMAGEYDIDATAKRIWSEQLVGIAMQEIQKSAAEGNHERTAEVATVLINDTFAEDPDGLGQTAMSLLSNDDAPKDIITLAHKAARKAAEETGWENWMALYAYAWSSHRLGDKEAAVKWQTKVMELAPEQYAGHMQERLTEYKGEAETEG